MGSWTDPRGGPSHPDIGQDCAVPHYLQQDQRQDIARCGDRTHSNPHIHHEIHDCGYIDTQREKYTNDSITCSFLNLIHFFELDGRRQHKLFRRGFRSKCFFQESFIRCSFFVFSLFQFWLIRFGQWILGIHDTLDHFFS